MSISFLEDCARLETMRSIQRNEQAVMNIDCFVVRIWNRWSRKKSTLTYWWTLHKSVDFTAEFNGRRRVFHVNSAIHTDRKCNVADWTCCRQSLLEAAHSWSPISGFSWYQSVGSRKRRVNYSLTGMDDWEHPLRTILPCSKEWKKWNRLKVAVIYATSTIRIN